MKKGLSLIVALIMTLTLASCGGNNTPETSETSETSESIAVSSEPTSSVTKEIKSLTASTESKTEETSEEEYQEEEEVEEEEVYEETETESADVEMVAGDNSFSLVSDGTTLVTFTLPDDSPIYYKLTVDGSTAIMTHDIMEDISGGTIVEWFEGEPQDYIDFYKPILGIDEDNEEMLTKDLNGKEVLICKDVREPDGQNKYQANYLIAVPVTDGIVLGFRVDAINQTDSSAIFDDSTVDLLLNHCAF